MKHTIRKPILIASILVLLLTGLIPNSAKAQDNVGIGTNTPVPSAILELLSANKGMLVPRMNTAAMNAIASPANSLLIYNTDTMCYFFYRLPSATWVNLCSTGTGGAGTTGPTGPAGTNGTNGTDGATGATGIAGTNGTNGATGTNGTNGTDGVTGATGATGSVGPTGFGTGTPGATGPTGANGVAGTNGATGVAGPTGTAGTNGINGATGVTGVAGTNGATGAAGTNGTNGATGATGVAGTNGTNGTTGPTGTAGTNGTNGAAGATGATGPSWTLSSITHNADGTITLNGTAGSGGPISSANAAWLVGGNTLTPNPGIFGSLNNNHVDFYTNNTFRGRWINTGELSIGSTTLIAPAAAGDKLSAFITVNTNNWAINGVNTTPQGGSLFAENTGTTNGYNAIEGITAWNGTGGAPCGIFGLAIDNTNTQTGVGVRGSTNGRDGYGVWGSRVGTTGALGFGGIFQNGLGYSGALTVVSDEKTKTNIRPIENALELIKQINGVNYENNLAQYPYLGISEGKQYGFVAQQLEKVIPQLVEQHELDINGCKPKENKKQNTTDFQTFKMVNYIGVIPVLVEAIKEQQKQIEELKTKVQALESK